MLAVKSQMVESSVPEVGEVPHQPERHIFPRRQVGKSKVVTLFKDLVLIIGSSYTTSLAFCHTYMTAIKTGKMKIARNVKDSAFIYNVAPRPPNIMVCFAPYEPSCLMRIWPDRLFLASYSRGIASASGYIMIVTFLMISNMI